MTFASPVSSYSSVNRPLVVDAGDRRSVRPAERDARARGRASGDAARDWGCRSRRSSAPSRSSRQREHTEGENVDRDEARVVAGVPVSLASIASIYRRWLDRDQRDQQLRGGDRRGLEGRQLAGARVVATWTDGQPERLAALAIPTLNGSVIETYTHRFWIEAGFRTDKSAGCVPGDDGRATWCAAAGANLGDLDHAVPRHVNRRAAMARSAWLATVPILSAESMCATVCSAWAGRSYAAGSPGTRARRLSASS